MNKILFAFSVLFSFTAFAYECSIQTEFFRTLPVFLGTTGTLEITSENIITLNSRGTGVQTESKGNVVRYFYPAERIEAHIIKTKLNDTDVSLITAPKYFNCNIRHALLRKNKIVSLSYCSVDGCRHITPEICSVLTKRFSEDAVIEEKNVFSAVEESQKQVAALSKMLHNESSLLHKEYERLAEKAPRVLGVTMGDFTPDSQQYNQGLLKLGGLMVAEAQYCQWLGKNNLFWKPEQKPSQFLKPKSE